MASATLFEVLAEHLASAVHNFNAAGHTLKIYLSNTTPSAGADAVKADLAEIGTGNGYSGPVDVENTLARSGNVTTISATKKVITCTGGAMNAFRYVALMNEDPTSPADPLIEVWDYGSALTLNPGETFSWKPNNSETTGAILTITS
jgi:hypothetical protein